MQLRLRLPITRKSISNFPAPNPKARLRAFFMSNSKLPDWARWLAMDKDQQWWCYEAEPHQHSRGWYENEIGRCKKLSGFAAAENWKTSLRPVKK